MQSEVKLELVQRLILNPLSLLALSVKERLICDDDAATALRPLGAFAGLYVQEDVTSIQLEEQESDPPSNP